MTEERLITIEIKDGTVYISEENSSGASYPCANNEELCDAVKTYLDNYCSTTGG